MAQLFNFSLNPLLPSFQPSQACLFFPTHPPSIAPDHWSIIFFYKSLLNLLQYCFCFMFCFFGNEACEVLAPGPVTELRPLHWKVKPNHWTTGKGPRLFFRVRSGKKICLPMQEMKKMCIQPLGLEGPWRRKRQPTPVFLPGKSRVQRSPEGCSPCSHKVRHNRACTHLAMRVGSKPC